ncbi:MAG: hypothetical protein VX589_16515 [Myxococcota bacterium]|nr:hypothetical protein [Myxococcota bacterium]
MTSSRTRAKQGGGAGATSQHPSVTDALQALSNALVDAVGTGPAKSDLLASVEIDLSPTDRAGWKRRAHDVLREVKQGSRARTSQYSESELWCFQCGSLGCGHGAPPSDQHVFAGYLETGKPQWRPFLAVCLETRPPGLDALFTDPPGVVVLEWAKDDLHEERLSHFGEEGDGFEVVAQAAIGLLNKDCVPGKSASDSSRKPVIIQVIRLCAPRSKALYQIRIAGMRWAEIDGVSAKVPQRHPARQLSRALANARRRLTANVRKANAMARRGEAVDLEDVVNQFIARFATEARRIYRPAGKRTKHAQLRHRSGERPTSNAWADAREVAADKLLYDTRRETYIVIGKKGRAHVFTQTGQHVTSLRLAEGEIDSKVRRRRWRIVAPTEYRSFRQLIESGRRSQRKSHGR